MNCNNSRIVILTDRHICDNPRVWKEANVLAANGYHVTVLTSWFNTGKRKKDRQLLHPNVHYRAFLNLIPSESNILYRLFLRGRSKLAQKLKTIVGIDTRWLISLNPAALYKCANEMGADLYIAHVETGLYAGNLLLKNDKKVAFDFEDWYSKDYLVPERPVTYLSRLEAYAVKHSVFCICPSDAMAAALTKAYLPVKPVETIYNGFSSKETIITEQPRIDEAASLVWFSQTIGPGRGLEFFFEALSFLKTPVKVVLIGNCSDDYKKYLNSIFPFSKGHLFNFEVQVLHTELVKKLSSFTIGLALELKFPESRNKTITNKILQYLQAGIKVLATDTDGQLEVASHFPGIITTVPMNEPDKWAKALESLILCGSHDKNYELSTFKRIFSLDAQQQKILNMVANALSDK